MHQYISEYCTENLTEIAFWHKPNIPAENFVKSFVNVETVYVHDSDLGRQLPSFVEWFPNVRFLWLHGTTLDHQFINASFSHLEHLSYREAGRNYLMITTGLSALLHLNQQLKSFKENPLIWKLTVKNYDVMCTEDVILSDIQRLVNEHPSLVELDLWSLQFTAKRVFTLTLELGSMKMFTFRMKYR